MGGPALLHTITFGAVIVMILLTVWIVLLLESGSPPPREKQEPGHDRGQHQGTGRNRHQAQPAIGARHGRRFTGILSEKGLKLFAVIDQAAEAAVAGLTLRETVLVIFG